MSKVIMMVGIPGSGKTTFCKECLKDWKYVSRDEIRFSLLKDDDDYFAREEEVFKQFVQTVNQHIENGDNVIIDATHISKKSRKKVLSRLARPTLLPLSDIYCIYMKTPFGTILNRNRLREGRAYVPEDAICSMSQAFEMPELNEGFTKIITIEGR
jgi:predicted kinase